MHEYRASLKAIGITPEEADVLGLEDTDMLPEVRACEDYWMHKLALEKEQWEMREHKLQDLIQTLEQRVKELEP